MKKSLLRKFIRESIQELFSNINKTSTSIVTLKRGFGGDDDGFIDDDTLYNLVIPRAIKYAIYDAIQYNEKILDRLKLGMNDLLLEYGIKNYKDVISDEDLSVKLLEYGLSLRDSI